MDTDKKKQIPNAKEESVFNSRTLNYMDNIIIIIIIFTPDKQK